MEEISPSSWALRLEDRLKALDRGAWQRALHDYDKLAPLGHAAAWSESNVDPTLGPRLGFVGWKDGRVNYVGDARVFLASRAFKGVRDFAEGQSARRLIALYYPFLGVIPLASLGLTGPVADLSDSTSAEPLLGALNSVLLQYTGRRAIPESALPDTRERLEVALCIAAVTGKPDRKLLIDRLLSLSAFVPDADAELAELRASMPEAVSSSLAGRADAILTGIRARQQTALNWATSGEGVDVPNLKAPLAIGTGQGAALAQSAETSQAIYGFAFLYAMLGGAFGVIASWLKQSTAGLLFVSGFAALGVSLLYAASVRVNQNRPLRRGWSYLFIGLAAVLSPLAWAATCLTPSHSPG